MGVLHFGKLQVFYPAITVPGIAAPLAAYWHTIADFEFGKDYAFSCAAVELEQKAQRSSAEADELRRELSGEDTIFAACLTLQQLEQIAYTDDTIDIWPSVAAAFAAMRWLEEHCGLKTRLILSLD